MSRAGGVTLGDVRIIGARQDVGGGVAEDEQMGALQTVRDRVIAMGLNLERFDEMLAAGRVWVGGEPVTDPHHPAPWPVAILYGPS
jgi:hypothetical protein